MNCDCNYDEEVFENELITLPLVINEVGCYVTLVADVTVSTCRHGHGRLVDIKNVQSAIDEVEGEELPEADKAFALQHFQAMKDRDLLKLIDEQ